MPCSRSQAIFGAPCDGSAFDPVRARIRSAPTRSTIAAICVVARRSIQIGHGPSGLLVASTGTTPSTCAATPRARISPGRAPASATAAAIAVPRAVSQAMASCSAHPGRGWPVGYEPAPRPRTMPASSRRTVFVDWVPTSQPMTKMACLLWVESYDDSSYESLVRASSRGDMPRAGADTVGPFPTALFDGPWPPPVHAELDDRRHVPLIGDHHG